VEGVRKMNLKKISLLFLLTFFLASPLFPSQEWWHLSSHECLVNIRSKFMVGIVPLSEDAKKIGLTEERLRTITELRLRKEGMTIIDTDGFGFPIIMVNAHVIGSGFSVMLKIGDSAKIQRVLSPVSSYVTIWELCAYGIHGNDPESIASGLSELIDRFLNDYYKANPKKEDNE